MNKSWKILIVSTAVAAGVAAWLADAYVRPVCERYRDRREGAEERLAELRALDPDEPARLADETARLARTKAEFLATVAAKGLAEIPKGSDGVFAAREAICAAIERSGLHIVFEQVLEEARLAPPKPVEKPVAAPEPTEHVTAAEYKRRNAAVLATITDKEMRRQFERNLKRKVAELEAEEKAAASRPAPQPAAAAAPAARPAPKAVRGELDYRTAIVAYRVRGSFPDIYRFLVSESYLRPAYALADIAVAPAETGMEMSFKLKAYYR